MAEPALDCPGVVALVGEGVAAGVAEHVRMRLEFEAGPVRRPLAHAGEAEGEERCRALGLESPQDLINQHPHASGQQCGSQR
jgi:hypothetical protein